MSIQEFDFAILNWIQNHLQCAALDWIVPKITVLGNAGVFWIIAALVCLAVPKWRKCGVSMALALIMGLLVGNLFLKLLVARDRPCWIAPLDPMLIPIPKDYSFPSCHTLSGMAASVSLLHYYKKAGIAAVALAVTIALTRLYLYVHFPTDVLVGGLLGTLIAIAACAVNDRALWGKLGKVGELGIRNEE